MDIRDSVLYNARNVNQRRFSKGGGADEKGIASTDNTGIDSQRGGWLWG